MDSGLTTEFILLVVSMILWGIGFIAIVMALVKGKNDMKKYHFFNIIGLSLLVIGAIMYIIKDYIFANQLNPINLILLVLILVLVINNIIKFKKL